MEDHPRPPASPNPADNNYISTMRASCRPHRKLGPKKPQEPHVSQTRFLSSINKPSGVEKNRENEYCKAKMARKGNGFRVLAARYRTCWPVREKGSCGLCHSRCLPGQRGLHGSPAFSHPNRELLVSGAASHTMVFHTGLSALSLRGTLTLHQRNNGPLNTNHHIWGMDVKGKKIKPCLFGHLTSRLLTKERMKRAKDRRRYFHDRTLFNSSPGLRSIAGVELEPSSLVIQHQEKTHRSPFR